MRQIARDNIKLDDKQLNKKLAKKIINFYYFTDRNLEVCFNINLDSHHINHANSKLKITPIFSEFGIEACCNNKIMKELSLIYARLVNQYIFKYQTVVSARFDKQDEDNQVLYKTEIFINLNTNHNLKETNIDNIDVISPSEHKIQQQEMKDPGWRFDKTNSMNFFIYKTGELNGSNYVKIPLRSNAIMNNEKSEKF